MQRQVSGMENPLLESGTYSSRRRVVFRHEGQAVEPIAGQFMLDFAHTERVLPAEIKSMPKAQTARELFARGVSLEDDPASQDEAIATYRRVLDIEPRHAASHINLGTVFYHRRDFVASERHYRSAIEIDPRYALAYFDLGNVLDETSRLNEAIDAYKTAILLAPTYADAHYNVASGLRETPPSAPRSYPLARIPEARRQRSLVGVRPQPGPQNHRQRQIESRVSAQLVLTVSLVTDPKCPSAQPRTRRFSDMIRRF